MDAEDLQRLVRALEEHVRARAAPPDEESPADPELLEACCLTVIAGPAELGVERVPSPAGDRALAVLGERPVAGLPEAEICRFWLAAAAGEIDDGFAERLVPLASSALWEPVESLAGRALAYFGRRRTLAGLLGSEQPRSLARLDLRMEAASPEPVDPGWIDAVAGRPADLLSGDVQDAWIRLLRAEWSLAHEQRVGPIDSRLTSPPAGDFQRPTERLEEALERRIAARSIAAAIRGAVAVGRLEEPWLEHPAARLLPWWEREYLRGLLSWRLGDVQAAATALERALELNPHQTCTRVALAAIEASKRPDRALGLLEHEEATRQMLIARAALLARRGSCDESAACLASCEAGAGVGSEAVRVSWGRGRAQTERRYRALATALAEHSADWTRAEDCLETASAPDASGALGATRSLYQVQRELASSRKHSWRRSVLEQKGHKHRRELADQPLVGDARFFRAVALADTEPGRAVKDLRALLHQPRWLRAELAAGGRRIVAVGDLLLRLGCVEDAIRAYGRAADAAGETARERLAVARIYSAWRAGAEAEAIVEMAGQARETASPSPWPPLVAAFALLSAGQSAQAAEWLEAAEQCGAPQEACRCLRAVIEALTAKACPSEEELAALDLPPQVEAVVGLLSEPEGGGTERMARLVERFPDAWIDLSPTDPLRVAWRVAAVWCDAGRWDDALRLAAAAERLDRSGAAELAGWVRLRQALDQAARGELEQAGLGLGELEGAGRHGSG